MHLQKKCFSFPKTAGSNCCEPSPLLFICNFFKAGCKLVSLNQDDCGIYYACAVLG